MKEVWKRVIGEEDSYEVSNIGRVRSIDRHITSKKGIVRRVDGKMLTLQMDKDGYLVVSIARNGKYKTRKVHRLVVSAFIGVIPVGMVVNHKNGIKADNRVENLEITTLSGNAQHSLHVLGNTPKGGKEKPVEMLDMNDNILKTFSSLVEAANYVKLDYSSITLAIKREGTSAGCKWRLIGSNNFENYERTRLGM